MPIHINVGHTRDDDGKPWKHLSAHCLFLRERAEVGFPAKKIRNPDNNKPLEEHKYARCPECFGVGRGELSDVTSAGESRLVVVGFPQFSRTSESHRVWSMRISAPSVAAAEDEVRQGSALDVRHTPQAHTSKSDPFRLLPDREPLEGDPHDHLAEGAAAALTRHGPADASLVHLG